MLAEITIFFFGLGCLMMMALIACYTAFITPWNIYMMFYKQTKSIILSFVPAFIAAMIVCYLWTIGFYFFLFHVI